MHTKTLTICDGCFNASKEAWTVNDLPEPSDEDVIMFASLGYRDHHSDDVDLFDTSYIGPEEHHCDGESCCCQWFHVGEAFVNEHGDELSLAEGTVLRGTYEVRKENS